MILCGGYTIYRNGKIGTKTFVKENTLEGIKIKKLKKKNSRIIGEK